VRGQAFLAQVIDGLLNIVAILGERFLAIEDAAPVFSLSSLTR